LDEYNQRATNSAQMAADAFNAASDLMTRSFTRFVTTGKFSFKDFTLSIAQYAAEAMAKKAVASLLGMAMEFGLSFFAPGAGAGASAGGNTTPGFSSGDLGGGIRFAKGGAFNASSNIYPFAKGGAFTNSVVSNPTVFKFANGGKFGLMGEAGPEAVMPLSRDSQGRLGVHFNGGDTQGATQQNVSINITVNEADGSTSKTTSGAQSGGEWNKMADRIKGVVREELITQRRPGGMLYA
jgi:lambda family phage tail tape measure protein